MRIQLSDRYVGQWAWRLPVVLRHGTIVAVAW